MAGRDVLRPIPLPVLRGVAPLVEAGMRLFGAPQPVRAMVEFLIAHGRTYSMDKAARLLDWRPRVGLAEGMAQAEAWLRETGLLRP
jgi:nucleoside-diphosphate-sugar epimerase